MSTEKNKECNLLSNNTFCIIKKKTFYKHFVYTKLQIMVIQPLGFKKKTIVQHSVVNCLKNEWFFPDGC